jgi:uncharacterized protein YbjT (DUF2867 family)
MIPAAPSIPTAINAQSARADGETFTLILAPTGPGPDGIIRLRRALKILLRACGLRCVSVRENGPADGDSKIHGARTSAKTPPPSACRGGGSFENSTPAEPAKAKV